MKAIEHGKTFSDKFKGEYIVDKFKYSRNLHSVTIIIIFGVSNMENIAPSMIGERLPVMAYVDPETFIKIEVARGDVSRSKYVGRLLKKIIEQ